MKQIILASKSPRRKELFQILGLEFKTEESNFEENLDKNPPPKKLAIFLSQGKAKAVAKNHKDAIIIAADTLVAFQNKILGKPQSPQCAFKMLNGISGKPHSVVTGFTVIDSKTGKTVSEAMETKVYFRKFSPREIKNYIKTGEPLDKAGAYAIQGLGQLLIKKIEGSYSNVVGLPLTALAQSLKKFGINVL